MESGERKGRIESYGRECVCSLSLSLKIIFSVNKSCILVDHKCGHTTSVTNKK